MKVKLYTDGASRGNPGKASAGAVAFLEGKVLFELSKYLGKNTNNFAEYMAVILSFEKIKQTLNPKETEIELLSDSNLLVNQAKGLWKVKHENIKPLWKKLKDLEKEFKKVSYRHIPREKNSYADALANKALDELD